jgi:hypothetical protein
MSTVSECIRHMLQNMHMNDDCIRILLKTTEINEIMFQFNRTGTTSYTVQHSLFYAMIDMCPNNGVRVKAFVNSGKDGNWFVKDPLQNTPFIKVLNLLELVSIALCDDIVPISICIRDNIHIDIQEHGIYLRKYMTKLAYKNDNDYMAYGYTDMNPNEYKSCATTFFVGTHTLLDIACDIIFKETFVQKFVHYFATDNEKSIESAIDNYDKIDHALQYKYKSIACPDPFLMVSKTFSSASLFDDRILSVSLC